MNYSYDSDDNIVNWKDETVDAFDFFTIDFLTANVLNEDSENRFNTILESLIASDSDELMFICALMNAYATIIDDQSVIKKLQRDITKIQKKWKMRYQQGCKQISQKLGPALVQKNKKQSKTKGISARQVTAIKPASGYINIAKGFNLSASNQPLLNGQAKLTLEDGSVVQGIFKDGVLNGLGKLTQPDGTIYIGNFVNNVPKGEGVLKNSSQIMIIGVFDGFNGDKIKDAIIKYPSGVIYKGQVKNYNPTGKGELKLDDGKIIIGNFENGIASGYGKIIHNGYEYTGLIANNNANGLGKLHGPDGSELEGFFTENLIQGVGQYKINGVLYFGECKENKPQGRGVVFFSNSWLQGTVVGENLNGHGIGMTENFIYDGEIKDSDIQGFGTIYYKDGRISFGNFVNGQLVRPQQQKSQAPCNSQAVRDLFKFYSDIMETTPDPYSIQYLTFSMKWLREQLTSGIYKHCFEFQHIFLTLQEQFEEWNSYFDPDL
jgi:hypothetical protein